MPAADLEIHLDDADQTAQLRADAYAGLTADPKWLSPKWFYDARGSELFEQITRLPEYFPTRLERGILAAHADRIAGVTGVGTLVELGSGSSEKTRLLLDALHQRGAPTSFVPLDISAAALADAVGQLATDYPGLQIQGVVGDFTRHLKLLPAADRRLVAFLGGTIGNLPPAERARFLAELRSTLEPGDWLLLGAGLVTDPAVLVPAYDDAAGVTAKFNRNVLQVLNRELGADFDVEAFDHVALWNPDQEWIEMRLRATRQLTVRLPVFGLTIEFVPGEDLRTETSTKFRRDGLTRELAAAGFALRHWWTDPADRFSLSLAEAR